jgi:hypothetical protein
MTEYNTRHGGPFDRGSADYYFWGSQSPHYYRGNTGASERIEMNMMSDEEIAAYHAGYESVKEFDERVRGNQTPSQI